MKQFVAGDSRGQAVILDGVVDGGGGEEGIETAGWRGGGVFFEDGLDNGALGLGKTGRG